MVTSYLIAVSTTVYISLPREVVSTESQFFYKTAKRLKLTVIVLTELQKYQEKTIAVVVLADLRGLKPSVEGIVMRKQKMGEKK